MWGLQDKPEVGYSAGVHKRWQADTQNASRDFSLIPSLSLTMTESVDTLQDPHIRTDICAYQTLGVYGVTLGLTGLASD